MKTALAILALTAPLTLAQSPAQPIPPTCASPTLAAFDIASVKPSQIDSHSSHSRGTVDTITASGSIFLLLQAAYDLHRFQISGGPDWINTATWDIVAKVDQPAPDYLNLPNAARGAIQQQRLQAVLAQRFNLKCHFEMKELPVYNLVIAKGGPKLMPTPAEAKVKGSLDEDGRNGANRWEGKGVEVGTVAKTLSYGLGRTVIDKTGLTGLYDFTLTYSSEPDASSPASADDSSGPTIFTALEEQLGLRLEPSKGPIPVLVIDSISRPSEN